VVELVVGTVLDRGDAAHGVAVAQRNKQLAGRAAVERVPLLVQRVAHGDAERRYPMGGSRQSADVPRHVDEPTNLAPRSGRNNVERHRTAECNA
jgi:hypothetical protein